MKILTPSLLLLVVSGTCFANPDIQISGTTPITINVPKSDARGTLLRNSAPQRKSIRFLHIELSEKAKQSLESRTEKVMSAEQDSNELQMAASSKAVALGMNGVPVLDQGRHGTCATFAVTAAIDAALNKGDYVSQLCSLQLGNYLAGNAYQPSGWDGSLGKIILAQMDTFGFMSKTQEAAGCGGINSYPALDSAPTSSISPEEFHQRSEPLSPENLSEGTSSHAVDVAWTPILDINQVFDNDRNGNDVLRAVKIALSKRDRVTFGVLLPAINLGTAGAVGKYHNTQDSWLLTPEVTAEFLQTGAVAGHEMVITGFDDKAVATDSQGRKYQGLLTMRNSWGTTAGDQGNFYMAYDYFKTFVLEAHRIRGEAA